MARRTGGAVGRDRAGGDVPATGADAWFGSVGGARESPPEPSKPPQVADLLEQVVTSGGRLVGASHVLVYLIERDTHGGQRLIVRRGAGCFATSMGCSVGKGEGLAGEVWRIGAPLAVEEDWPARLGGECRRGQDLRRTRRPAAFTRRGGWGARRGLG